MSVIARLGARWINVGSLSCSVPIIRLGLASRDVLRPGMEDCVGVADSAD